MQIILGDTPEYLANDSQKRFPDSILLTLDNHKNIKKKQTYYTSIGDIDGDLLYPILINCEKIYYHPPNIWSDSNTEKGTISILRKLQLLHDKEIINLDGEKITIPPDYDFLSQVDDRKTDKQQIWISGCSFAKGIALEDQQQRYGQLISNHFNLPASFLVKQGSSIDWAADQILRADMRSGDILVWGLTGINRNTWFDIEHQMMHLSFSYLTEALPQLAKNKKLDADEKMMYYQMLFSDAHCLLIMRQVHQVRNLCNRLGVNLVIMMHPELSQDKHVDYMQDYLTKIKFTNDRYLDIQSESAPWELPKKIEPGFFENINFLKHRKFLDGSNKDEYRKDYSDEYLDVGSDKLHPGPITHRAWARKIIDLIEKEKWITEKY
jgi:hypothetical protein